MRFAQNLWCARSIQGQKLLFKGTACNSRTNYSKIIRNLVFDTDNEIELLSASLSGILKDRNIRVLECQDTRVSKTLECRLSNFKYANTRIFDFLNSQVSRYSSNRSGRTIANLNIIYTYIYKSKQEISWRSMKSHVEERTQHRYISEWNGWETSDNEKLERSFHFVPRRIFSVTSALNQTLANKVNDFT